MRTRLSNVTKETSKFYTLLYVLDSSGEINNPIGNRTSFSPGFHFYMYSAYVST